MAASAGFWQTDNPMSGISMVCDLCPQTFQSSGQFLGRKSNPQCTVRSGRKKPELSITIRQ